MIDWLEIITASEKINNSGESAALATIVRVDGSHYREVGARLLVNSKGELFGTSGGGCFESDLIKQAAEVIKTGFPELIKYTTSGDDDPIFGSGTGCGGEVYYLLERYPQHDKLNLIDLIICTLEKREQIVIATVIKSDSEFNSEITNRSAFFNDGSIKTDITSNALQSLLSNEMKSLKPNENNCIKKYQLNKINIEILWEKILPPVSLVIFGGGDDAKPLVNFAQQLGWITTIVDHRAGFATPARFPNADLIFTISNDQILKNISTDNRTATVILTHNFLHDQELLKILLPTDLFYLGLLGSKNRIAGILDDIKKTDHKLIDKYSEKLFAPIGSDIGANGSVEISLAIMSEILAVFKGKQAGFLRDKIR